MPNNVATPYIVWLANNATRASHWLIHSIRTTILIKKRAVRIFGKVSNVKPSQL